MGAGAWAGSMSWEQGLRLHARAGARAEAA